MKIEDAAEEGEENDNDKPNKPAVLLDNNQVPIQHGIATLSTNGDVVVDGDLSKLSIEVFNTEKIGGGGTSGRTTSSWAGESSSSPR